MTEVREISKRVLRKIRPARFFKHVDEFAVKHSSPIHSVDDETAVFLTFDDGPHGEYTAALGELFARRNHRATFFFAGSKVTEHPELVTKLVTQGHGIGSHSATHLPQWSTPGHKILRDYWAGHRLVERSVGHQTRLFRPPYGHQDWRSALFVKLRKLDLVLWDVDSLDWQPDATAQSVVDKVIEDLEPGSIVLLHDAIIDTPASADRSHTVAAVEQILDHLEAHGLRSKALSG